jgi:hypothetical protein
VLLDGLVESLPAARLLLLVNRRPEYRHQWGSRIYYSSGWTPLPPESAEHKLDADTSVPCWIACRGHVGLGFLMASGRLHCVYMNSAAHRCGYVNGR